MARLTSRLSYANVMATGAPPYNVFSDVISFPIPLAAAPIVAYASDPSCTGSVSAPTAAAGVLCIYPWQTVDSYFFVTDAQGNLNSASPQGADLQVVANSAGDSIAQGIWAVTAPSRRSSCVI